MIIYNIAIEEEAEFDGEVIWSLRLNGRKSFNDLCNFGCISR